MTPPSRAGSTNPQVLIAAGDIDALLASDADSVSYVVQGETRVCETIGELCRTPAAGTNVVNTSLVCSVGPQEATEGCRVVARREGSVP